MSSQVDFDGALEVAVAQAGAAFLRGFAHCIAVIKRAQEMRPELTVAEAVLLAEHALKAQGQK